MNKRLLTPTCGIALLLALSFSRSFAQNYLMNANTTSINDCSGFFLDSGGGGANYAANQHFVTTICPDFSTGTHVQLVFSSTHIGVGDELCFFDGTTTGAPSLNCVSDFAPGAAFIIQATAANASGCITIQWDSDGSVQGAGWSADINCIPACQTILSDLASSNPVAVPADTGWIDICPGERVFFTGTGIYPQNGVAYQHSNLTSDFEWDFGDGDITYGPNVSHIYDEPGGYIVQLSITDQYGCKNTNYISQRIRVAPRPTFQLGTWTEQICAGDTVQLNASVDSLDANYSVSVAPNEGGFPSGAIRSDSLALPDGNGNCYSTSLSFTDFSPGQILTDINDLLDINVIMEHSWMRDLKISLTCPNGQSATLHNHAGQIGGEVFLGFPYEADEGIAPIPGTGGEYGWSPNPDFNYTWLQYANAFTPSTLPQGTYNSFQPLNNFIGCPLNGDWTIEVCDNWPIDNGYIFSWSINFDPALYPDLESFKPALASWQWKAHPSIIYSENDSIVGSPVNAGGMAYTFIVTDEFGCVSDTTLNIQVLPETHPDCHTCNDLVKPLADSTVCTGESVVLDAFNAVPATTPVTFENYPGYQIGAANHPIANPYNSVIAVNSILPTTVTNPLTDIVSVCVDLSTDFDGDINMFLISPGNDILMLSTGNGGSGDNYTQTCFTPTAVTNITAGTAPFTGNYRPEGLWSVLNGENINGNWTLRVSDAFGLNNFGTLNWWAITFNSQNNVTYSWSPATGLSCTNCPTPTATPGSNANYIVTASDSYACTDRDTASLVVLSSFPAPTVSCQQQFGGQVAVSWNNVSPGSNYEINVNGTGWQSPNNGNLAHIVNGLSNGDAVNVQVRVLVTGGACTVDIGTSSCLYQLCPIDANLTTPAPYAVSCNGECDGSVAISVVNGTSPFNFTINNLTSGTSTTQSTGNLANLCPGSYLVVVNDFDQCFDTVNFTVNEPPDIAIGAQQTSPVSCAGGNDGCASAMATGGVGSFNFMWGNSLQSIGQTVCALEAGTISVTATDATGCTASTTVNITEPFALETVVTYSDVNCMGGSDGTATATPSGGNGGYTFQWSGGLTPNAPTATGLSAGTYSVTVMDVKGCQDFDNVTIGEPTNGVEVTAVQTIVSCFGEDLSRAEATAAGGAGGYTFLWTPSNQTQAIANDLAPGTYTVVATDVSGCSATATVEVEEWDEIQISVSFVPPTCHNAADGEMAANIVTGGDGNYSYKWSNSSTDVYIDGLQGGLTYIVTVTDGQGCSGTLSRTLDNPPAIVLTTAATDAKCFNTNDGVATVTNVQNAQGSVSYTWDANTGGQMTAVASNLSPGTYTVMVEDSLGCTASASATISNPEPMTTTIDVTDNKCYGDGTGTIDLKVSGGAGGYQFNWSNGGSTSKLVDLDAATYFVTITDANGCERVDSALVDAPQPVTAILTVEDVSCAGKRDGSIHLETSGGTSPFTYSTDGVNFFGSSTLIALKAGEYEVFIRDGNGCIFSDNATVNEPLPMEVKILTNATDLEELMINFGEDIQLDAEVSNATGMIDYVWSASYCGTLFCDSLSDCDSTWTAMACEMPISRPEYTTDYFLTAIDENGCRAEDHLQVHVKKTRRVVVPTGFTPNQDNTNDRLTVHGKSGTTITVFQVFDRWGELLFEQFGFPINDMSMGWDGTFKGKEMMAGVYVWYLEAEYEDGMKESFKGESTLIR